MGEIRPGSKGGAAGPSGGSRPASPRGRWSARVLAGRLVEVRVVRLVDISDIVGLNAEVHAAIRHAGPGPAVLYADHRRGSPVPSDVADAWARGMREANRTIAGSAILVDPANVTFNLQIERIVRCAGNASRLIFSAPAELQSAMASKLATSELEALRRSLCERDPGV